MRARQTLAVVALGTLFGGSVAPTLTVDTPSEFPVLEGPYLGQEPPGSEPVLFAPGIVTTDTPEWSATFTPDGLELFFGVYTEGGTSILHMTSENGRWTEPRVASFSGRYPDFDLTMGPDGDRLWFTSTRPATGTGPKIENPDLWSVDRIEGGWGEPVRLPEPINTEHRELYPSESKDGFLYFFSSRPGGLGGSDIYGAPIQGDQLGEPVNLGPGVNSEQGDGDVCVSPDGSYLVFSSRREGGLGNGDLYVSFKRADGTWTKAQNLGPTVNTEHLEFCPGVSRDGRYLFFTSNRPKPMALPRLECPAREALGASPEPDRADIDIYWMDAGYVEGLRPEAE